MARAHQRLLWLSTASLAALLACGRAEKRTASGGATSDAPPPADSLVATNADGVQIWFTLVRVAKSAEGTRCVERGLEIRRGETRVKVPLLYTATPPVLLNDWTIRALLWSHCKPGDSYLVDLRSGQPVRERATGES